MIEKVNPCHPDKVADRIAGAIVDLAYNKQANPKIAVEVLIGHGVCHIISESSCSFKKSEIKSIVNRIVGKCKVDFVNVAQDVHLSKNQEYGVRCGDNGIFKGVPITKEQKRDIYNELLRVYCIGQDESTTAIYEASEREPICDVRDYDEYERLCRILEFAHNSAQSVDVTDADRIMLSQKREALRAKEEIFKGCKNITKEALITTLYNTATNSNINAMSLLSFMEYHGILMSKDAERALRRMRVCASWNNLFGNLMCIAYSDQKAEYYDNLYTVFGAIGQGHVLSYICGITGYPLEKCKKDRVARIIDRAFGQDIISRKQYDRVFSKLAHSELLSIEDKEKLLLSKQKDVLAQLSELPFDIQSVDEVSFDSTCFDDVALLRQGEIKQIKQNLALISRCSHEVCSPLLIASGDEFVSDMYCEAIKKGLLGSSVVLLDAGTLCEADFAQSKENVFLRAMCETKASHTVFVIKDCENLDEGALCELEKMLGFEYRKSFKLVTPPVSIDLSTLHFVLLSSKRSHAVNVLSSYCDTVWTDNIAKKEKSSVVRSIFNTRKNSFGCCGVAVDDAVCEYLAEFSSSQIQQIVDRSLKNAIFEGRVHITLSFVKEACENNSPFSQRNGFGYTGGVYSA